MLFRVTFVVICALGLLWVGHKQQQTPPTQKLTGVVSDPRDRVTDSMKKFVAARTDVEKRLASVPVPNYMVKYGKPQRLSREQKRTYAILTVFFANDPVMVRVAACESSFRHELPDGQLNVGPDGKDKGAYMIREPVHEAELVRYRIDPSRFEHNVAFATHLYHRDGLRHWRSSRPCWETVRFV